MTNFVPKPFLGKHLFVQVFLHRDCLYPDPTRIALGIHLLFNRASSPQRHGHELARDALGCIDSVKPGLIGQNDVALRVLGEPFRPPFARYRVDLSCTDLQGRWQLRQSGTQ